MPERKGKCTNLGNCPNADTGKILTISEGAEFVCPEPDCGLPLMQTKGGNGRFPIPNRLVFLVTALILFIGLIGFGVWKVMEFRTAIKSGSIAIEQLTGVARWLAVKFAPAVLSGNLSVQENRSNKLVEGPKIQPNSSPSDTSAANPVVPPKPALDASPATSQVSGATKTEIDQLKQDTDRKLQELQAKAQEELQKAQEKSREDLQRLDAKVNLQQGLNYARLKDYNNSLKEFSIAVQKDDRLAEAYSNRAAAYMQLKMYNEALQDLNKAVELKPKDPVLYYNLASLYAVQKQYDLALKSLDDAFSYEFKDIATLRNDPDFKQLRSQPGYRKLLEKYGIPQK